LPINLPDPPQVPEGPPIPLAGLYAMLGVLLGVGAPAGALVLRLFGGAHDPLAELRAHAFFYEYGLIGSCLVFGVAGLLAGRRADLLRSGRDRYRDLSERDSLTGLVNARTFLGRYRRAMEHAARYREPISLLVLDVDHLKAINDSLGHAFGTAALLHVARILADCKRADDMAARWGGDEFALLMPGADAVAARRQADAILDRLRREPLSRGTVRRPVSVTIGVATGSATANDGLFERADRALYAGKRTGGDRSMGSP
jgi:diguanylate cyclase (GGDEF)-like protein